MGSARAKCSWPPWTATWHPEARKHTAKPYVRPAHLLEDNAQRVFLTDDFKLPQPMRRTASVSVVHIHVQCLQTAETLMKVGEDLCVLGEVRPLLRPQALGSATSQASPRLRYNSRPAGMRDTEASHGDEDAIVLASAGERRA